MPEMLKYIDYKRRYTLFLQSHFVTPRVYPIARYQLPKLSILHYIATDGVSLGPQVNDPLMRRIPGVIYVDHLRKYTAPIGSPIKTPGANPELFITEFRRRNRAMRPLKNLLRLEQDTRSLVIFNYSMLAHLVRYAVSFRAHYYQWYNIHQEVVRQVNELAQTSERHQFIEVELPEVMPALTTLREFAGGNVTSGVMKRLRTNDELTLADLFVWAGKHRDRSVLGKIDPKHYAKVNLVIRRLNGFVVVNLAWLDGFRKNPDVGRMQGMEYTLFELRVLKLLTQIHQATTLVDTETGSELVDEEVVDEQTFEDEGLAELNFDVVEGSELTASDELEDGDALVAKLERELEELDAIKEASKDVETIDDEGNILEPKTIDVELLTQISTPGKEGEAIVKKADELAAKGILTTAEHRRLVRVSESFNALPDPYGNVGTIREAMELKDEDILIEPDVLSNDKAVVDKSLTLSRVDAFERQYIQKVLKKDIMRCVAAMQRAPVAITGYSINRETDAVNDKEVHVIKLVPAAGAASTIKLDIPVVKPDGSFLYNSVNYRARKQRADLPLRKISPTRVALSSYYAKLFVERSDRTRFNYSKWFINQLILKCLNPEDPNVSDAVLSRAVDYKLDVSLIYSTIAERITAFRVGELELWFDHKRRVDQFGYSEQQLAFEKKGWVMVGKGPKGPLIMDPNGMIYAIVGSGLEDVGTVEYLTGISLAGAPTSMVEVKVYSKNIPIGVALAYLLGLDGLLNVLKANPRRVLAGERLNLADDEYVVRFKNESLVFNRNDQRTTLIMSGFNLLHAHIRNYDVGMFDEKDVYAAVMERAGIGARYLRELDSMNTLFIDPITEDLLKWMKEPITVPELLIRAVEMLQKDTVETRRHDKDGRVESLERVRGYERIAGMVYETLSKAVRQYSARAASGRASIVVNPNEVMGMVIKDPTTAPVNNINPIHSLREREVLTFGGRGGRSRRAMVASARLFTEEDLGFVSEGTVDSGDVAIITYLSPNANLTSVRGTVRLFDPKRDGASSIMSSPALLSPTADGDDPKRIGFIQIQHGHGIRAVGNECQPIRTGMERSLVARVGSEFASTAKGPGEVIEKSDTHIVVQYKDGEIGRYPLGLLHTTAEGSIYPNTLLTQLNVGDKVEEFDVITYNQGFFKPNPFDKKRVDYMMGCMARVALREAVYTVEDSSSISVAFAERMLTYVSKLKSIRISDFRQEINGLVKVGDTVDLDTILCTIEDAVSADAGLYDETTRETLKRWAAMTPRAKVVGTVSKIEVYYNGDIDEMSDSLQRIVAESEKDRRRTAKKLGVEYTTGYVNRQVRIDGHNLENNQAVIQIYITTPVAMGTADKLVVGNQGKSTVGEILFGENTTLDGEPIDLIFGAKSFIDRIITSPFVNGSTNTVLRYIGEDAYKAYFGDA